MARRCLYSDKQEQELEKGRSIQYRGHGAVVG
jgi:hypothetical protein